MVLPDIFIDQDKPERMYERAGLVGVGHRRDRARRARPRAALERSQPRLKERLSFAAPRVRSNVIPGFIPRIHPSAQSSPSRTMDPGNKCRDDRMAVTPAARLLDRDGDHRRLHRRVVRDVVLVAENDLQRMFAWG